MPVDASVAATLRPTWPDLPTPETITRPSTFRISSTASAKAPSRLSAKRASASASSRKTRRAVASVRAAGAASGSAPSFAASIRSLTRGPLMIEDILLWPAREV